MGICERSSLQTQISEEGRGRGVQVLKQRFPCTLCKVMEEPCNRAGGCLRQIVLPWEVRTTAGSWKNLWLHEKAHTGSGFLAGLVTS